MNNSGSTRPLQNVVALVVEDQPADIEGTLISLKRFGMKYENVGDLETAEKQLQSEDYDLVILDLRLPQHPGQAPSDDAGVSLITKLQKGGLGTRNADKPFIVISGQNKTVAQREVDQRGNCWGIYGKLMHSRILNEMQRRAEVHFRKNK